MKKAIIYIVAALLFATAAQAEWEQDQLSVTIVTTNSGTDSAVVRGYVDSIYLVAPANKTNAVSIKDAEGNTILAVAALTASGLYRPYGVIHKATDGTAITDTYSIYNTVTNGMTGTNPHYARIAVVSELTMTVTGAADTTGTNTTRAIITWQK